MIVSDTLHSPSVRHGFFSRDDGLSQGLYAGRNCGPGSADDPASVQQNRARVARDLGLEGAPVLTCYQVHSGDVVTVSEPWDATSPPQADAIVTRTPGLVIGVLTADCAPVLFADADAGVIAAAHAGWRGAVAGVVESTVTAMVAAGAEVSRIQAVLGPCIHQPSYEVGDDLRDAVGGGEFFIPGQADRKWQFDLPGYVVARLRALQLGGVEVIDADTYADEARFYSFRRATHRGEGDYGRQLSAIALQG